MVCSKQQVSQRSIRSSRVRSRTEGHISIRWHHIIVAFLTGILVAYAFLNLSISHPLLRDAQDIAGHATWGPEVSRRETWECQRPAGFPPVMSNGTTRLDIPERLIVAARHSEDTSWLDLYLSHIPHIVYQVEDPKESIGAQYSTLANKGNEAMAYLQFIIDFYDILPPSMVFLHGHRGTWHMRDHVPVLQRLRWGQVAFANLRFANTAQSRLDWECGNQTSLEEFKAFDCDWQGSHLRPLDIKPRKASELTMGNKDVWWDSVELREVWPDLYQDELGELPSELSAPCCAEFIVSRERVLTHSKDFYIHMRNWIIETELGRYRSGRVFEYMWHVIFGEPHVISAIPECLLLYCDDIAESA